MTAVPFEAVKENLLIEGLVDAISLGEIHGSFFGKDPASAPPVSEVQANTLAMVRELLSEGLFVLGTLVPRGGFQPSDMSLETALRTIEEAYVQHHDDRDAWMTMFWLLSTEKGEELARALENSDDT